MKEYLLASLAAVLVCLAIPAAVSHGCEAKEAELPPQTTAEIQTQTVSRADAETEPQESQTTTEAQEEQMMSFDETFNLPVLMQSGVDSMSLHDYLVGALSGEMPLSFDTEALKAQAVACRTYALRQYAGRKHDPAAVCTVSSCCECWVSTEGIQEEARKRAEQAVSETDGLVLTYDGKLIEATFFSCSGGKTERAADVWGGELAYLQSVDSPGEEAAPRFLGSVTVSAEQFCETLLALDEAAEFPPDHGLWSGEITRTAGGGVGTILLGGRCFTGKQLRKAFGLNSTDFELAVEDDSVTFRTRGFGHRVGMSQYGAQAMAQSGADFREILCHYYTGVAVTDCRELYPNFR